MVISPRAPPDNLNRRFKSFRISEKGFPVNDDSVESKLSWLRSQVIGGDAAFSTSLGIRRITYADHTATGRSLRYIEDYIINNVLPYYGNTHTSDSYIGHRTTTTAHEATAYIKHCLGGGPNDALIFTGSGTTAAIKRLQEIMGITIPSIMRERVLQTLSKEEKWVVFVGPFEHHSNILSWRQTLAEVVEIGLNKDGLLDMEDLRHKLEEYGVTNRPMLGSFSACSNVTGVYSDTRRIATLLHQHGGFACFDFAASGPYTKIDMRSGEMDGYDAIFLSPPKFIGGPGSSGILLLSKPLYMLKSYPPSTCGGGTVDYVNGFNEKDTLYLQDIEEREDAGTPPIIQKIRAALAFWVKEYIGYKTIHALEHNYTKRALQRLLPNSNIRVLGNTSENRQSVISFLVYTTTYSSPNETSNRRDKPLHGPFVAKLLNDLFGIQARGGCACAGPYAHILLNVDESLSLDLRSAIQKCCEAWLDKDQFSLLHVEEFEFILAALEFVAIYGQRFLQLYHLNWKTGAWTSKKNATFKLLLQQIEDDDLMSLAKPLMMETKNEKNIKIEVSKITNANDVGIVRTYASYLETAKRIGCLLPKLPSKRPIPDDIDIDLLPLKV